jgi:hypothetical protein
VSGDREGDDLAARALHAPGREEADEVEPDGLAGLRGAGAEHRPAVDDGERERDSLDPGELVRGKPAERESGR